jgi:hypothetical protein
MVSRDGKRPAAGAVDWRRARKIPAGEEPEFSTERFGLASL